MTRTSDLPHVVHLSDSDSDDKREHAKEPKRVLQDGTLREFPPTVDLSDLSDSDHEEQEKKPATQVVVNLRNSHGVVPEERGVGPEERVAANEQEWFQKEGEGGEAGNNRKKEGPVDEEGKEMQWNQLDETANSIHGSGTQGNAEETTSLMRQSSEGERERAGGQEGEGEGRKGNMVERKGNANRKGLNGHMMRPRRVAAEKAVEKMFEKKRPNGKRKRQKLRGVGPSSALAPEDSTCDLCGRVASRSLGRFFCWTCGKREDYCHCSPAIIEESKQYVVSCKGKEKQFPADWHPSSRVHLKCGLMCDKVGVVETADRGRGESVAIIVELSGLRKAIEVSKSQPFCQVCKRGRATCGCRVSKCQSSCHYPCLIDSWDYRLDGGRENPMACAKHWHIPQACHSVKTLSSKEVEIVYAVEVTEAPEQYPEPEAREDGTCESDGKTGENSESLEELQGQYAPSAVRNVVGRATSEKKDDLNAGDEALRLCLDLLRQRAEVSDFAMTKSIISERISRGMKEFTQEELSFIKDAFAVKDVTGAIITMASGMSEIFGRPAQDYGVQITLMWEKIASERVQKLAATLRSEEGTQFQRGQENTRLAEPGVGYSRPCTPNAAESSLARGSPEPPNAPGGRMREPANSVVRQLDPSSSDACVAHAQRQMAAGNCEVSSGVQETAMQVDAVPTVRQVAGSLPAGIPQPHIERNVMYPPRWKKRHGCTKEQPIDLDEYYTKEKAEVRRRNVLMAKQGDCIKEEVRKRNIEMANQRNCVTLCLDSDEEDVQTGMPGGTTHDGTFAGEGSNHASMEVPGGSAAARPCEVEGLRPAEMAVPDSSAHGERCEEGNSAFGSLDLLGGFPHEGSCKKGEVDPVKAVTSGGSTQEDWGAAPVSVTVPSGGALEVKCEVGNFTPPKLGMPSGNPHEGEVELRRRVREKEAARSSGSDKETDVGRDRDRNSDLRRRVTNAGGRPCKRIKWEKKRIRVPPKVPPEGIKHFGKKMLVEDLSQGLENFKIPVTNDVDDDLAPTLMYIVESQYQGMDLATYFKTKCSKKLAKHCTGCTSGGVGFGIGVDNPSLPPSVHAPRRCKKENEPVDWMFIEMNGQMPYDFKGRLLLSEREDVFECNSRCGCDPATCINRELQKGMQFPLEIFKTPNRGWAVLSLTHIPRGKAVCQYVGEIITDEEAGRRGEKYDSLQMSSLYNLDHPKVDKNEMLVIDGEHYSNVAKFINHSCDGNLAVYRVFDETKDWRFSRLGMYAIKDIAPGEELTYDYMYDNYEKGLQKAYAVDIDDDEGVINEAVHNNHMPCLCGTAKCRGWLWGGR